MIPTHQRLTKNQPLRPWNAPIVLGWKPTATALACGNTVREAQKGSEVHHNSNCEVGALEESEG